MTYIEPKVYELPSPGQHAAVLAEELDLGNVNTIFGPKPQVELILLVDENGSDGKPLAVHVRVTKTRSQRGNLYEYVQALCSPQPVGPDSWELSQHVGKCIGLDLVHVQKNDATYCNVTRVFALGKTVPRLTIPLDYVCKADRDTSFAAPPEPAPVTPPAPPAAPAFPGATKPKIVAAPTSSAIRATALKVELNRRSKGEVFHTGQTDQKGAPAPLA